MTARRRLMLLASVVSVLALALAMPVGAQSTEDVVTGHLEEFAAGVERGYDISGPVRLKRGADWTEVKANAQGLPADSHTAHLHESACDVNNGGGHYKDDPNGAGAPPNELWLEIETNPAGNGHDSSRADWRVRDGDRSVVIHDTDGARIACADLPVN